MASSGKTQGGKAGPVVFTAVATRRRPAPDHDREPPPDHGRGDDGPPRPLDRLFRGDLSGADYIFVPEVPIDLPRLTELLKRRRAAGKNYRIVIVSEGARFPDQGIYAPEGEHYAVRCLTGIQSGWGTEDGLLAVDPRVPRALSCFFPDVSYVSSMDKNDHRNYRFLFWMSTVVAAGSIAGWHFAARAVEEHRLDDPHELSRYRGIEYPFTIDVYGYKYQGKTGDYIDDHILAYGAYEKDVLYFMRDYVETRKNADAVFLDVGACEGQHSLFMSRLVKQVHAFEPYPPAADRFQGLIDLNQFPNIRLHRVGLGDKDATVPFFAPPEKNIGSGTFLSDHRQGADKPVGNFRVVAGDEWLEPFQLPSLDLIKIDVEGFEKYVLQGLAKSLVRYRPVLVIEVSYPPIGKIAILAELKRLFPEGYQLLNFQSTRDQVITGNYKLNPMRELKSEASYCMVVAYPKERESAIRRERR